MSNRTAVWLRTETDWLTSIVFTLRDISWIHFPVIFASSWNDISHLRNDIWHLYIYIYIIYIYIYIYYLISQAVFQGQTDWLKSVCLTGWLVLYIHTSWYNLNPYCWYFCIFWKDISHLMRYIYVYIYMHIVSLSVKNRLTDWLKSVSLSRTDRLTGWLAGLLFSHFVI